MTTPITNNTAQRIIRMAYKDAGLLGEGDEPNGEQYVDALARLNDFINLWQTQGMKLFLMQDITIPLTVGKGIYTLSPTGDVVMPRPLQVQEAYYIDNNNIRRPLIAVSRQEFYTLSQPLQQGPINSYFIDKQATSTILNLWLVPDTTAATGTVHLEVRTQISNFVSLTDQSMFPVEWFIALRWALADELTTGQPQAIVQRCAQRATAYREVLEAFDVEDASVYFTPDPRAQWR